MKAIAIFFLLSFFAGHYKAQQISGFWKGVTMVSDSSVVDVIHVRFDIIAGLIDGELYLCPYQKENFSSCSILGEKRNLALFINAKRKLKGENRNFKEIQWDLHYNKNSGYLEGNNKLDTSLRIVLYKDNTITSIERKEIISYHWVKGLLNDIRMGVSAPIKRKEELLNFTFETVYFDYDKFVIRTEHLPYLNSVVRMLNSHSDIRLKITGHTDSDGSNIYNDKLSKKRVQAMIDYFVEKGIEKSRIVIDYKGERLPITNNDSESGKQKNRRVTFEFI